MSRRARERYVQIFREKAPQIYWCANCNVPVLRRDLCGKCGEKCILVENIAYPRDVRLAFRRDLEEIIEAVEKCCGIPRSKIDKLLSLDEVVLLNKIQHVDAADEVIARGVVIGARYFNVKKREWEFRPNYVGIRLIVEEKLGYYAILRDHRYCEGEYVDRSLIVEGELPAEERAFIPFKTLSGFYGIAQVRRNKLKIVKIYKKLSDIRAEPKASRVSDVVEANLDTLVQLERFSLKVIRESLHRYSDCFTMVTCSGGKDSTAVAYLASEAGVRDFVYCDTTLDFPETHEVINELSKIVPIETVTANRNWFEKLLNVLGPPARDLRWCTTVCKLLPLKGYIKERAGSKKTVSITGQRLYESPQRALAGYETKVYGPNPADIIVSPLYEWCALEVELYLVKNNLPLNRLYELGFERVGCFMCPTLRVAEIKLVEQHHPELWGWWLNKLRNYMRRAGLPEVWLTFGLWRWRFKLPGDYSNYLRSIGVPYRPEQVGNPLVSVLNVRINEVNNEATIEYVILGVSKIKFGRILSFLPILSREWKLEQNILKIYTRTSTVYISESGRVTVWSVDLEVGQNLSELIFKIICLVHFCIQCGECVAACPREALDINAGYPRVKTDRCDMCRACLKACPIAKYFGITFSHELEYKLAQ